MSDQLDPTGAPEGTPAPRPPSRKARREAQRASQAGAERGDDTTFPVAESPDEQAETPPPPAEPSPTSPSPAIRPPTPSAAASCGAEYTPGFASGGRPAPRGGPERPLDPSARLEERSSAAPLDRTAALGPIPRHDPGSSARPEPMRSESPRPEAPRSEPARRVPREARPEPVGRDLRGSDFSPADPELLPERPPVHDVEPTYAPPPPVRRRRMSATTRFYLGFAIVFVLVCAVVGSIGFALGSGHGAAAARASQLRTLQLEAQCLRDVKAVGSGAGSGGTAFGKAYEALAGANRCAQTNRLPSLSPADLDEVSGVRYDGALPPPPGDPRWAHPESAPPKAGGSTGIVVRGL